MSRFFLAAAIAAVVLTGQFETSPAEAASAFPWCARSRISEVGAPSCGFSSYAQCVAVQGGAGGCTENPFYTGPSQDRRTPQRRN